MEKLSCMPKTPKKKKKKKKSRQISWVEGEKYNVDDNDDDVEEEERDSLSHLLFYMHVCVHALLWNWYRGQCNDGTHTQNVSMHT